MHKISNLHIFESIASNKYIFSVCFNESFGQYPSILKSLCPCICQQYMICPSCTGNHDNYRKFIKIILTRCLWFSSIVTLYPSEVFTFMCCFREQIWIVTFMSFVAMRTIIKLCTIRQTVGNSSRVGLAEFWNFIYQINRS